MKDELKILSDLNKAIIGIRAAYAEWTKAVGVGYHEMLLLYTLRDEPLCSQKQICEYYRLPKQTVHNALNSLRQRGFIEFIASSGRQKQFRLTDAGEAHMQKVIAPLTAAEIRVIDKFGRERAERMTEDALMYGSALTRGLSEEYYNDKDEKNRY